MALVKISILLLLAAFLIGFIDAARPDYKYINATRAWYKYHKEQVSWYDARETCRLEGGLLVHPNSKDEASQVIDELNVSDNWWFFLHSGLSDLKNGGHYVTEDGRPIEQVFHEWAQGEPAYGSSQGWRCGVLGDHALYVRSCNWTRPFICKAAADPPRL